MSEHDSFLVKSIEEIKSDVKNIYSRLGGLTVDLQDYKNQRYKCLSDCDGRYLKLVDVENTHKREQDKYTASRETSAHRKTGILVNVLSIIHTVSPYIAILTAFAWLKNN